MKQLLKLLFCGFMCVSTVSVCMQSTQNQCSPNGPGELTPELNNQGTAIIAYYYQPGVLQKGPDLVKKAGNCAQVLQLLLIGRKDAELFKKMGGSELFAKKYEKIQKAQSNQPNIVK